MKAFIKVNTSKENFNSVFIKTLEILSENNFEIAISDEENLDTYNYPTKSILEGINWCDVVITIGGDGTILSVGTIACEYDKPIFGINCGNLGFLTTIERNQLDLLKNLGKEDFFKVSKHNLLKAKINDTPWVYCLNDIAILKNMFINTISLDVKVDNELIFKIEGDGVVIATPSGSTAYSLSVGGPVVDTDIKALIVSAIAPHNLNSVPLVLAKDKKLKIKIKNTKEHSAYIAFDGTNHTKVNENDVILVKSSKKYLKIFSQGAASQFIKVDNKLRMR